MATHRRYTKHQKLAAVASAEINGIPATAEAQGIPETTIRYWLDRPEFVELRAKTRDEMRDGFKVLVHKAQERLTALVGEMEPRDLTVLLGVATDKTLLMSGDATTRSETRTWTDDLDPDSQRRLRDWAFERLDELDRRTGDAEGDAAGAGVRESPAS